MAPAAPAWRPRCPCRCRRPQGGAQFVGLGLVSADVERLASASAVATSSSAARVGPRRGRRVPGQFQGPGPALAGVRVGRQPAGTADVAPLTEAAHRACCSSSPSRSISTWAIAGVDGVTSATCRTATAG